MNATARRLAPRCLVFLVSTVVAVAAGAEVRIGAAVAGEGAGARPAGKVEVATSDLLLPFYLVDTTQVGITTLFAVRNESEDATEVTADYFRVDRPDDPVASEAFALAAKQVKTVNIRDKVGPLKLLVDGDGFARGYVRFSSPDGDVIQGDGIFVDTKEAFAQGDRLIDTGLGSAQNGLCQRFEVRYLNGGGFSSTVLRFFVDADEQPSTLDPIAFYTVYNEAGVAKLSSSISSDTVAFEVGVQDLINVGPVSGPAFGVIEIELNGFLGHVAVVMSAGGQYSVGFSGACLDTI